LELSLSRHIGRRRGIEARRFTWCRRIPPDYYVDDQCFCCLKKSKSADLASKSIAHLNLKNLTPHGRGVRGLTLSRSSILFGGAFGRIFRALPPAEFGANDAETQANLKLLGKAMVGSADPPKDGPDPEESGIPRCSHI
jgi:hypothetical protein